MDLFTLLTTGFEVHHEQIDRLAAQRVAESHHLAAGVSIELEGIAQLFDVDCASLGITGSGPEF
ncbi:MAG: hypothetical protein AB8B85_19580 [Paracoccaceae bacterium]